MNAADCEALELNQRQLLEELARASGDSVGHPRKKNFLEKVRELFE